MFVILMFVFNFNVFIHHCSRIFCFLPNKKKIVTRPCRICTRPCDLSGAKIRIFSVLVHLLSSNEDIVWFKYGGIGPKFLKISECLFLILCFYFFILFYFLLFSFIFDLFHISFRIIFKFFSFFIFDFPVVFRKDSI